MPKHKTIPADPSWNDARATTVAADTSRFVLGARLRCHRAAARSRFRGSLVDNCRAAPMGKGHGNQGKPFDIETACYIKPLVAAFHRDSTRKLVIMAGVKTLKSFFVEMAAAYHLAHSIGDVMIYFATAESSEDVSTTRILDYNEGIPSYREKLETITNRWDVTMGAVKFPDKTYWLKTANLANTQQKNLGFMGVQDAFLTGATGMIDQGIERTTQYPHDKKIVLESQGGEKGFDFDRHYLDTDQGELHVVCPACGRSHVWNWKAFDEGAMTRPDDFQAALPRKRALEIIEKHHGRFGVIARYNAKQKAEIEKAEIGGNAAAPIPFLLSTFPISALALAELAAARTELTARLLTKPRRVAGFQRGPVELIKLDTGEYDEAAVKRETHFECFHCGEAWRDDGEFGPTRIRLDRSSHYVSVRRDALIENVGFNIPQWINRRLPWGNIMLEKLKRQRTAATTGNFEPLKQWWQKFAARTWDPEMMHARERSISPGSYDPNQIIPDEHSRNMAVDCQQDQEHMDKTGESITGWFWYIVRVVDQRGNSKQLARGYAKSWSEWIAAQNKWKVPNDRVVIDINEWPTQIITQAVERREIIKVEKPAPPFYLRERLVTWCLFYTEPRRIMFKHKDGQSRPWSPEQPVPATLIQPDGRHRRISLRKIRFDRWTFQLQLDAIRSGAPGMPKFEVLGREHLDAQTQAMETNNLTYARQMDAQYYVPEEKKYKESRPDDHYLWCENALLVRQAMDGLFGHVSMFESAPVAEA